MRKLALGSIASVCAGLAALGCNVGTAAAYGACGSHQTASPCNWYASAGDNSPYPLVMQGGGNTNFEIVPLNASGEQYNGCYGPSGVSYGSYTCDLPQNTTKNTPAVLVSDLLTGAWLYAGCGYTLSQSTNLWFPYS